MSIDVRLINVLKNTPGWQGAVYNGYAPQDPEQQPTALPFTIVEMASTEWESTTCGTILDFCFAVVNVIYCARTLAEARAMADDGRGELCTSSEIPGLENEAGGYDPQLRAWAVTQTYRVSDDRPSVVETTP